MSVLDHHIISERYFFPRPHALSHPTWVEVDGARLACHHERRGHPLTLLHFHGNGEVCGDYLPDFVNLCDDIGLDCFLAEYRGYGASSGVPQLGKMLEDVHHIVEAVGRPPEEIVVFGRSVGSIYAVEAASKHPFAGLVLESGIADARERILMRARPEELGSTPELIEAAFRARLDHKLKLSERTQPTLVMHARHDSLVSATHGRRLASYPAANARLVLFSQGDHNTIFYRNQEDYLAELKQLVDMIGAGENYDDTTTTMAGGVAVFDKTDEFMIPTVRSGPGETRPVIDVPDALTSTERAGPGDTMETRRPKSDDE